MRAAPLVSIIITNYNYRRFLPDAISSALGQTYAPIEVLVVDDGSSDGSQELIAAYGDRVVPILKANGGQASAFNAGFARSQGQLVLFLDADDWLYPDTVQRAVDGFRAAPGAVRLQFRMALTDAHGRPAGATVPPAHVPMTSGDVCAQMARFNDCGWVAPTSGNLFAASCLRQIMPMPEPAFRISADYYLTRASALCGPVAGLDFVGAGYRQHGANHYAAATLDLDQLHQDVALRLVAQRYIAQAAATIGVPGIASNAAEVFDIPMLAQRMALCKLAPHRRPIANDTPLLLLQQAGAAVRARADMALPMKLAHLGWFLAMALATRPLARWLATCFFNPAARPFVNRLLALGRRLRPPGSPPASNSSSYTRYG